MKKLKSILVFTISALITAQCANADAPTFKLTFDEGDVFADVGVDKTPSQKIQVQRDNFVVGYNQKKAFTLVDEDYPRYISSNINLPEGTLSFWFKPIKWIFEKPARFLHLFCAGKNQGELIIFYFNKRANSDEVEVLIFVKDGEGVTDQVSVLVPDHLLKESHWQKIDVTWNADQLTVYLDGELVGDKPMPALFSPLANAPKDWGTLSVLPVFPADGDDWAVKTAIDDIVAERGPLSPTEVQLRYKSESNNRR